MSARSIDTAMALIRYALATPPGGWPQTQEAWMQASEHPLADRAMDWLADHGTQEERSALLAHAHSVARWMPSAVATKGGAL